jgi:hypothetical protein
MNERQTNGREGSYDVPKKLPVLAKEFHLPPIKNCAVQYHTTTPPVLDIVFHLLKEEIDSNLYLSTVSLEEFIFILIKAF